MAEILRLEILAHPDYEETTLEELWPEKVELETKLSQAEIEALIEEHEAAGEKRKLEIEQKLRKETGEKNVRTFIKRQKRNSQRKSRNESRKD